MSRYHPKGFAMGEKSGAQGCGQTYRPPLTIDTSDEDRRAHEHHVVALYILIEQDGSAAQFLDAGLDHELVVEPCWRQIIERGVPHDEGGALDLAPALVLNAEETHHLGARALDELQIIRVVDDARGIGVLVVDADRKAMHARRQRGFGRQTGKGHAPRSSCASS